MSSMSSELGIHTDHIGIHGGVDVGSYRLVR